MGRLKGRISIREAERRKKAAILASPAFDKWLAHRSKEEPRPSDPYRAYMIDLSLHATKPKKEGQWEKEPNRLDISGIDTPLFATGNEYPIFAPAPKPRGKRGTSPPRKKGITYAVPEPKSTHEREIVHLIQSSAMKYNTAPPQIVVGHSKSFLSENYFAPARNKLTGQISGGIINIQHGEGQRGIAIATAAHETGHFIHANANPELLKKEGYNVRYRTRAERTGGAAETFAVEKTASKIAVSLPAFQKLPKLEQAKGRWALRTFLETYRHDATVIRDPTDSRVQHMKFGALRFGKGEEKKWGA